MKLIPYFNECQRAVLAIITVLLMVTGLLIYLMLTPPLIKARAQAGQKTAVEIPQFAPDGMQN